jgi:hypothetical protein
VELIAWELRKWLARTGASTLHIDPGSPGENGYCGSFKSKLRDEFLNGVNSYSLKEVQVLADGSRVYYNTEKPHLSPGHSPPAPAARIHRDEDRGRDSGHHFPRKPQEQRKQMRWSNSRRARGATIRSSRTSPAQLLVTDQLFTAKFSFTPFVPQSSKP